MADKYMILRSYLPPPVNTLMFARGGQIFFPREECVVYARKTHVDQYNIRTQTLSRSAAVPPALTYYPTRVCV